MKRPRIEVHLEELDHILDQALRAPLSEPDCQKLKTARHALAELLAARRTTEKTRAVVPPPEAGTPAPASGEQEPNKPNGHGRTPASSYGGASKVDRPSGTEAWRPVSGLPARKCLRAERT